MKVKGEDGEVVSVCVCACNYHRLLNKIRNIHTYVYFTE